MSIWIPRLRAAQAIFIIGVLLTLAFGASLVPSIKMLFWASSLAKVSSLKVETGPAYSLFGPPSTGRSVIVEYTYSVGNDHFFGGGGYPDVPNITGKGSREDTGFVMIRYNPAHPEQSVIPSPVSVSGVVFLSVGIACMVGVTLYTRRKKRRKGL